MHPHLSAVLARLDDTRRSLRDAIDAIPRASRESKPAADRWSAAEVLEHLSLVERKYVALLRQPVAAARESGLGPESALPVNLPADVVAALTDRSSRRVAPDPLTPSGTMDAEAAWEAVEAARADFRALLDDLDGLALGQIVQEHPRLGALNLYQWVEFITGHEGRHVKQIEEIARTRLEAGA